MYIGQYLPSGGTLYSPWFPREADNAYFTLETIAKNGTGDVAVTNRILSCVAGQTMATDKGGTRGDEGVPAEARSAMLERIG